MSSPHEIVNPPTLAEPVGFAHAVIAAPGRTVYLGGQAAHDADSKIVGRSIAEQFAQAAANVATAVDAAGAIHSDLARGFIRAQVIGVDALLDAGSMAEARSRGTLRQEGRNYQVLDGDVIEVLFNVAR